MNRYPLIPSVATDDLDPKSNPANAREAEDEITTEHLAEIRNPNETPAEEPPKPPKKERSLFVKAILAFLIVGAIIAIGVILPIKLIPNVSSIIATVFNTGNGPDEEPIGPVEFTSTKPRINSGESFVISWSGPVREAGEYALQYPCAEGVDVTLITASGATSTIPCGTPFPFVSFDNTMTLSIASTGNRLAEVPLSFSYGTDPETIQTLDDVEIVVMNDSTGTSATSTPSGNGGQVIVVDGNNNSRPRPTVSTRPAGTPSSYSGRADLVVRIINGGILNKNTGIFIPSDRFESTDRIAVQFEVVNLGTGTSGSWNFRANLPTVDSRTYESPMQAPLPVGGRTVFTLAFDNARQVRENLVVITADPMGRISDSNRANNTMTATFLMADATETSGDAPDLKVEVLGVGRMDGRDFEKDSSIDSNDRAAVQFKVTNIGGWTTQPWYFTVVMDQEDGDEVEYESARQRSLRPGESTVLTVAFDDIDDGDIDFEIEIDPDHRVTDFNRRNNDADATLRVR